jgi:ATP-dependent Clp protease ATP-binding subunit ClpX
VHPEDMIKFGMIPEFIGRVPVVATLHDLDRPALVAILKEPKNSLIKQYQALLEFENVNLRFTDDAMEQIAEEALVRNVGARGLKIILEEIMLDVMYRVPSEEEIEECVITKDVVLRRADPILSLRKAG